MKRILFVGNAGYIHTQRFACHYRDQGVDVHIASFQPGSVAGVTLHRLPDFGLGKAGFPLAVPALRTLGRRLRPDVVHAHYVTSYGFVAALAGLHPLVVTAWGTDVLLTPYESRAMRAVVRYALRHADRVTTVAGHMIEHVTRHGVDTDRVTAVPFGVDTERFVMGRQHDADGPLRIICTRNFDTLYDIPTLLRALARLLPGVLDYHVDLVGRGPLRDEIEQHVSASGLAPVVTFHGHVDHAKLVELLGRAHVFVSPAISDGNNVSLNEAMACGCFPIATLIPANSQWIDDGVNGLLFPAGDDAALADALRRALDDTQWRNSVRHANRRIVEERASWRACLQRNDEVYAAAIRDREVRQ